MIVLDWIHFDIRVINRLLLFPQRGFPTVVYMFSVSRDSSLETYIALNPPARYM